MVFRVFAAAIAAGLLSAILMTGLQSVTTTPLILQAETYEVAGHGHDAVESENHEPEWMPADGMERMLYTLLANFGAAVGFALLLIVGLTFDLPAVSGGRGVLWGLAGFAVFTLSPAFGLPPELPGMPAADLQARQFWWLAAVLLSAAGLGCLVFKKTIIFKISGLLLLVSPQVWGAPHGVGETLVPADLAARFSAMSIILAAVFWLAIGYFSGAIFGSLNEKSKNG